MAGTWSLSSKKDPRWNAGGDAYGSISAAMKIDEAVAQKKKLYGEPPDDLEYSFWKD